MGSLRGLQREARLEARVGTLYLGTIKLFKVFIGYKGLQPRILEDGDDCTIYEPSHIVNVPINWLEDFKNDIDKALRDIAGIKR